VAKPGAHEPFEVRPGGRHGAVDALDDEVRLTTCPSVLQRFTLTRRATSLDCEVQRAISR
jgi:hypothetical protein